MSSRVTFTSKLAHTDDITVMVRG